MPKPENLRSESAEILRIAQISYEMLTAKSRKLEMDKPENAALRRWFETRERDLPDMAVISANAADGQNWRAEVFSSQLDGSPIVRAITSGFGAIEGNKIVRGDYSWTQPSFVNKAEVIILPVGENGEKTPVLVSGFLAAITTTYLSGDKKMLLTVGGEPFMQTGTKKAVAKTPFQASVGKLEAMKRGGSKLDEDFAYINTILERLLGNDVLSLLQGGAISVSALPPSDPNRQVQRNLGFEITIDPDAAEELTNSDKYYWAAHNDIRALHRARIINGHTKDLADLYLI